MSGDTVGSAEPVGADVLPFRRPPIRQSRIIPSTVDHTFSVFTGRLAEWWPLIPFSFGQERVRSVSLEQRVGGEVVETWDDGTTRVWGTLLEWDPPRSLTMTWNITGTATEVALRFVELAPSLTRVELEHRGWERLTDAELERDCAVPGGYRGGAFQLGWTVVLDHLHSVIGAESTPASSAPDRGDGLAARTHVKRTP